jgi:hypothetical protein
MCVWARARAGGAGQVEINDYPQHARWKATHKESLAPILEFCDVCITAKGVYVKPGLQPPPGERKLYLLIEGEAEMKVSPQGSGPRRRALCVACSRREQAVLQGAALDALLDVATGSSLMDGSGPAMRPGAAPRPGRRRAMRRCERRDVMV